MWNPKRDLLVASCWLLIFYGACATAEIYKTTDKNGKVTYTDLPPANSAPKPVELPPINTLPPTPVQEPIMAPQRQNAPMESYAVRIKSPANGGTLLPVDRSVTVEVEVSPALRDGVQLDYKVNGRSLALTNALSFTITEPPRGSIALTVDVVDSEGAVLTTSESVSLFVVRPSLIKPTPPVKPK